VEGYLIVSKKSFQVLLTLKKKKEDIFEQSGNIFLLFAGAFVNNIDGHAISMKQLNGKRKKTKMTQI
jgi:hypothetical protein